MVVANIPVRMAMNIFFVDLPIRSLILSEAIFFSPSDRFEMPNKKMTSPASTFSKINNQCNFIVSIF
jgi:hypothetical protein